jgi:DNA-binding MarR family transcriptional regulator
LADRIRATLAAIYPDLDTTGFALTGRVFRLARALETRRAEHLAAFDLTVGDFDVLATIHREGADGINPRDLLRSVLITSGGLTKRMDCLEALGFIRRHADPGDRRGTLLRLTPAGVDRIDQVIPSLLEMERPSTSGGPNKSQALTPRRS